MGVKYLSYRLQRQILKILFFSDIVLLYQKLKEQKYDKMAERNSN